MFKPLSCLFLITIAIILSDGEHVLAAAPEVTERTWRMPKPLTQTSHNCVGYMWLTWQLADPYPVAEPLSPEEVYRQARELDPWQDEGYTGTTAWAGALVLQKHGKIDSMRWTTDWREARDFLLTSGPVTFSTPWYEGMNRPTRQGYALPTGKKLAQHAYVCYNWKEQGKYGMSFGCQATFGSKWGQNGTFRLRASDAESLLSRGYAILATKR